MPIDLCQVEFWDIYSQNINQNDIQHKDNLYCYA